MDTKHAFGVSMFTNDAAQYLHTSNDLDQSASVSIL